MTWKRNASGRAARPAGCASANRGLGVPNMKTKSVALIMTSCLLAVSAGICSAQSLGEYARKQRAKEASEPKPAKVYTNDDIPRGAQITQPAPASAEASSNQSAAKPEAENAKSASKSETAEAKASESAAGPEGKIKTKEYWQNKFSEAKANLNRADEELKLSEDELNLEQMNEARELDPDKKAQLEQVVKSKQDAVDARRAAYDDAKQALEDLKKEFASSGAPPEWLPEDVKD
jgi:hypothetical protein